VGRSGSRSCRRPLAIAIANQTKLIRSISFQGSDRPKLINQARTKLALSHKQLKGVYRHVCEMVQSQYLTNDELVTVLKAQSMKYGWVWGGYHGGVVGELFGGQNVSEGKFLECLGQGLIKEEL